MFKNFKKKSLERKEILTSSLLTENSLYRQDIKRLSAVSLNEDLLF